MEQSVLMALFIGLVKVISSFTMETFKELLVTYFNTLYLIEMQLRYQDKIHLGHNKKFK